MTSRVEELCAGDPAPSSRDINDTFWQACHGGHLRVAKLLLARGADIDWVPDYAGKTPRSIAASFDTGREALITWLDASGAKQARAPS